MRQLSLLLGIHSQVLLVLLLEWLNSFRSFGLRFVQYNLLTDEYDLTDVEAGNLLGIKSLVGCLSGFVGSVLTDAIGVRVTAIGAISLALIGRGLLVLGRSQASLYLAFAFFSPLGDALLSNGLYRVALKKLTTPANRALVFSISCK